MKKFLFAILAGCSLLAAQANADALSILQNTRIKAQQTVSLSNLSNIFLTAARYLGDNRKYPTLSELNLPVRTLNPNAAIWDKLAAAAKAIDEAK